MGLEGGGEERGKERGMGEGKKKEVWSNEEGVEGGE